MTLILSKYIPPIIFLYDFIRKPKPRKFHARDLDEISKKIAFETRGRAKKILEEMYGKVSMCEKASGKTEVWIGNRRAFDIWATPNTHTVSSKPYTTGTK